MFLLCIMAVFFSGPVLASDHGAELTEETNISNQKKLDALSFETPEEKKKRKEIFKATLRKNMKISRKELGLDKKERTDRKK